MIGCLRQACQGGAALLRDIAPGRNRLQRVKDFDGARAVLGIHPAIPLADNADPSLQTELPLYVARDIDAALTTWFTINEQKGGLLLLVGPAGAGKTRSMYEAARIKLPNVPMFLPRTAEHFVTFLDTLEARGGPVVVWLNEIYAFLSSGGITAEHIDRAIRHSRSLLILASIWPERRAALINEQSGINRDALEILTNVAQTYQLSGTFQRE